jgi:hypothetical protein
MTKQAIKARIESAIRRFASASSSRAYALVPQSLTSGKLYEAHVLSIAIEQLCIQEGFQIILINSRFIPLKSSPGPINRSYPYFQLRRASNPVAELWTDIEFTALSYDQRGLSRPIQRGDYHELDIVVTDSGVSGRPRHSEVWLGIECKNTGYTKSLLKEILGIRRELSLLQSPRPTRFARWPRSQVPADPASCLMVFSTDAGVAEYAGPGEIFGIDFQHEQI